MSTTNIDEIRRLAHSFRNGIKNAVANGGISSRSTKSTMIYFPKGCCEVASDLLAQYLLDRGIHTKSVHGEYAYDDWENKYSHTWLETGSGVIIDITAEQFVDNGIFKVLGVMPCFVGTDRSFYSLFSDNYREETFHGLKCCDGDFYRQNVVPLYEIILCNIT